MANASPFTADETLARLTSDPNVLGCLILLRSTGSVLKTSGALFEGASQETARNEYALRCWNMVKCLASDVGALYPSEGSAEAGTGATGEEVKFARIRTRKHELIISPGVLRLVTSVLQGILD